MDGFRELFAVLRGILTRKFTEPATDGVKLGMTDHVRPTSETYPLQAPPVDQAAAPGPIRSVEATEITDFHDEPTNSPEPAPKTKPKWRLFSAIFRAVTAVYHTIGTVFVLAIVAAIPVANVWVLGYFLDAQGRLALSGRWRDGFPDIRSISRLASIGLGFLICLFPLKLLADAALDARIIASGSTADVRLHFLLNLAAVLMTLHLCLALARGGGLSCFFRPIKNARWLRRQIRERHYWQSAGQEIRQFLSTLQIRSRFWLGLRGFLAAAVWLTIPTFLYAFAKSSQGPEILVTIVGGLLLVPVLCWLPLLQARFSAERRFAAGFQLPTIRQIYRQAPLAVTAAVIGTLLLALPLYLAKIVLPPRDAMWLVTLLFIVSIWPVKLLTGWAYYQGNRRETAAWWGFRWSGRLVMVPLVAFYVFLLLFTQGLGEHGKWVLFEHHAFLLPSPF